MRLLLYILFLLPYFLYSQVTSDTNLSINATKPKNWDTTYYKKYDQRFIVSVYQSKRHYEIELDPRNSLDSGKASHHYFADANTISGIEIDFDKISLSFSTKSEPPKDATLKGKTNYTNFGVSFGGNKWIIENSYRKYKGFYDINTANYDTSYKKGKPYFQNPSMTNESIKTKFLYFTNNKKFSYKSAYTGIYRQTKTSKSWILSGNAYYNKLQSDSGFTAPETKKFYGSNGELKNLKMLGISIGGGLSINIVIWKSVFLNLTGIGNIESQWRQNTWLEGRTNNVQYTTFALDGRASIGINKKNFFISSSSINDINFYSSGQLDIKSKFYSWNFNIGYRFKVKTPTWYKKIQASKIYNMF